MKRLVLALAAALLVQAPDVEAEGGALFAGERIQEAGGFPAITRFMAGDPDKPLLVFVPGAHHTARVAYGGHEGGRAEDFLAHWLVARGYNFLGVSYPIGTADESLKTAHPDFMIRDWGKQVAQLTKKTIEENALSGEVIVLGWSMAGKITQSVWEAMQAEGVDMAFYVSLAATPAVPGLIAITRELPMLPSGYADRRKDFGRWYKQVAANGEALGRQIVPEDVFVSRYQGDIPVNLQGYGQQYRDGQFVMDQLASYEDAKSFHFDAFPLVAMIIPDGRGDRRHALTDQAAWSFYNANTVFKRWISGNEIDVNDVTDDTWRGVLELTRAIDDRLSVFVDGNHFFFVGEEGAKATASAIAELEGRVKTFKAEMSNLLGVEVK